jgi:hypothetical protein
MKNSGSKAPHILFALDQERIIAILIPKIGSNKELYQYIVSS